MPRRSLFAACAGLAGFVTVACGGASDVPRPSGERVLATPPDQCAIGAGYTDTLSITKFDTMGGGPTCGSPPDLICSFYKNEDAKHAPHGVIDEDSDCIHQISNGQFVDGGVSESFPVGAEQSERCGDATSALHFVATNLSMCVGSNGRRGWGASYEIDFYDPADTNTKAPIDASQWDGFSFWIKRGAGPTGGSIIVLTVDDFASGGPEEIDPVTGEAVSCEAGEPKEQPIAEADASKCDPFAAGVTISDDWTFVPIRFADLRQKGFGQPAPDGLDTSKLRRLQFIVTAGDWDFWLDDVAFFRDPVTP